MHLQEWLRARGRGAAIDLIRATRVSGNIVYAREWRPIRHYLTAKRIVEYTNGEVTYADLCEPANDGRAA